jgi:hypothetical protein
MQLQEHHSATSPFTFLNSAAQVAASGKSSPFVPAGGFCMNNLSALVSSSFSQQQQHKQNLA